MKAKDNIPDELTGFSRKPPFRVPESYFEELPSRLLDRVSEPEPAVVAKHFPVRRVLAMAAMFIGLVTVGYFGLRLVMNGQPADMLSSEEVSTAIEYYGYEFDDDMLISAIIESDIDLGPSVPDNETEVIIEYLSTEEIDFNALMNEE
jgi:hypothetical protein